MTRTLGLVAGVLAVTSLACSDIDRIRLKARLGLVNAQIELGNSYAMGRGTERDEKEAAKWYRRAAEQGHAKAQLVLGNRHLTGAGVEEDPVEAVAWFHKAAEQGDAEAQYQLALAYLSGRGVGKAATGRRVGATIGAIR